jgi:ATP/maltotriose-dependent transcriptional regulator MalT
MIDAGTSSVPERPAIRVLAAVTGRVLAVYRSAPGSGRDESELRTLTAREREVLTLIGGLTNDESATTLFVGAGTAKTHINHIFANLELRNRADAVIFACDHGLVSGRHP